MVTDSIGDFLVRIKNAQSAKHRIVNIPSSRIKKDITKILFDQGYILNFKIVQAGKRELIKIALKYHPHTKVPAIKELKRISRPGLRNYCGATEIPKVLNGLGLAILSTSKGVISDKEANKLKMGGEVICHVF